VAGLRSEVEAEEAKERESRQLRTALDRRLAEITDLRKQLGLLQSIEQTVLAPPKWVRTPTARRGRKAIVTLQLTDTHFDEVVNPAEVAFINAYDRAIAEQRLRRWVDRSIILARDYMAGIEIEGAVLFATGDILSGDIHAELKESNVDTLYASAVHWTEQLIAAISAIAEEFGKLHIGAVVGNHGRNSRKPVYKKRAQSNIEWLMWRLLARHFADDKRITFQVSDAMDLTIRVYDTNYLITHGDEFRGGTGISGAMAPLMLGQHRTTVRQMATDSPMDYLVVGHFHQYRPPSQGLVMGGSLKGYDEFAFGKRLRPEPAQQAFWITSPEHGPTISAPVLVQDREAEGW
jgi:hypothetical protein